MYIYTSQNETYNAVCPIYFYFCVYVYYCMFPSLQMTMYADIFVYIFYPSTYVNCSVVCSMSYYLGRCNLTIRIVIVHYTHRISLNTFFLLVSPTLN